MIQFPGTSLIKSENLHFAARGISSQAEEPAGLKSAMQIYHSCTDRQLKVYETSVCRK